ncbi:MAG: ATP-binding cassette domain-containing protein [Acidobacteriota bacterium]|nr:ATP-binding cassette domain-containing protein [Acidobacteriota bacterium]
MSVEVRNLARRFTDDGPPAVADVSFTAPTGAITAVLGPSGAGKSTVLRIIAGLEEPDGGRVLLSGEDVTETSVQKRGVGFVFQGYALFGHLSVRENVVFGPRVRGVPRKKALALANELLHRVQLDGLGDRRPSELSGGQRQRVAFARALAVSPRVLLLDEPFGALDAGVRLELGEWLLRLHDETGLTTLLVTHDQPEAFALAGHVVVLLDGTVAQAGTPGELRAHPKGERLASFLRVVRRQPAAS